MGALENLEFNVKQNQVCQQVQVVRWDWADELPQQLRRSHAQYCVGSEVAYKGTSKLLCQAILALKRAIPEIEVFLVLQERCCQGVKTSVDCCGQAGLEVRMEALASHHPEDHMMVDEDIEDWGGNRAFMPGAVSLICV